MATSRAVKVFVHKSGEVGFTKYTHVVYRTWLQCDWAEWLCRQALSWGITFWDYGGSAVLESLVLYCEAEKINLPPLKFTKQAEQFKVREVLILYLWVKNGWEWGTWIPTVSANSLSPTCLSVGHDRWVWMRGKCYCGVSIVLTGKAGAKNSLGGVWGEKGRNCLATPCVLLALHSPMQECFWVYGNLLEVSSSTSTRCAGLDKLCSYISDIVSWSTDRYFLSLITLNFPWCLLLYFLLLGRFLFKIKADASLTGGKPNEFTKSHASCWMDSSAIQLLQSVSLPTHFKDQQVTFQHFWQAAVLEKKLAGLRSYFDKSRTSAHFIYDKFRASTEGGL